MAAQVREHVPGLLGGDDRGVPARTWELSQFLTGVLGVEEVGSRYTGTVAYHPTCHSLRLLRVGDGPVRLLRAAPGVDLVELPDAEECCGFGGTFAVKNADVSAAMLDEKLAAVVASGADAVCACDSSCLMHIGGGLHRRGSACARCTWRRSSPHEQRGARRPARELPPRRAGRARERAGASEHPPCNRHDPREARRRRRRGAGLGGSAEAGAAIKDEALARLDEVLIELEASVEAAGGVVHWARDAAEANEIVTALVRAEGADEVVKVKSLATDEIRLNEALEAAGSGRSRPTSQS